MNGTVEQGEHLDGVRGKAFHVDLTNQRFALLKETVIDPQTDEGRSRHTVYWDQHTRFVRVEHQNSFEGVRDSVRLYIHDLDAENAAAAAKGEPFVFMKATVAEDGEEHADFVADARNISGMFSADPASNHLRGGTIVIGENKVSTRLRGPRGRVSVRRVTPVDVFGEGFWEVRVFGAYAADKFWASRIELTAMEDPRLTDDPDLPRVLIVGDSISMNYHDAAKSALAGIANYHRIEGNGGPTTRGLAAMELWLGDYRQKGLHWDLIQFNFGLHDLRQSYDEASGTFGEHQVDINSYKDNLERIIGILHQTGAQLAWCTTTPVPQNRTGKWPTGTFGRRKDEDMLYNMAALVVMQRHPEIRIHDVNRFVREHPALSAWREQSDVHFWGGAEQQIVGKFIAAEIAAALEK